MNRLAAILIACTSAVCLPAIVVAWQLADADEAVRAAAAAVLCLLPNVLTLIRLKPRADAGSWWFVALHLGTLLRFAATLGFGVVAYYVFPVLQSERFWLWILVFYLLNLFLLIFLLVRASPLPALSQNSYKSSDS